MHILRGLRRDDEGTDLIKSSAREKKGSTVRCPKATRVQRDVFEWEGTHGLYTHIFISPFISRHTWRRYYIARAAREKKDCIDFCSPRVRLHNAEHQQPELWARIRCINFLVAIENRRDRAVSSANERTAFNFSIYRRPVTDRIASIFQNARECFILAHGAICEAIRARHKAAEYFRRNRYRGGEARARRRIEEQPRQQKRKRAFFKKLS